ncbi:hypothetical protein NC653_030614 [Populus alba x Populus x berolinensis]|uniref:Uncharacterized protein n=1 Tax=Populus alba x Populus x berolinensis TaxID=444605 RepID=A0AAD6Q0K5_9ROSI|nr:hypothetical protein NC653_030598 [Populus alba x Populus x berolinensis]KAJ6974555.1 hypothetical protein NC653_030611 [Populus alba x Populus x berolinensis]KAJ6974558.1 hypothetical protein NC653_030614 [Populus alba x Populus x berolinensis]
MRACTTAISTTTAPRIPRHSLQTRTENFEEPASKENIQAENVLFLTSLSLSLCLLLQPSVIFHALSAREHARSDYTSFRFPDVSSNSFTRSIKARGEYLTNSFKCRNIPALSMPNNLSNGKLQPLINNGATI